MNPCIPHHKKVIVACASIISETITVMFILLHGSTNQDLFEKHVCNHSSHYENYDGAARPSYCLKLKHNCPSLSAMFDSLHSSMNQEVFEKNLCNKSSHYEKCRRFLVTYSKGSHHMQPPN